jgi:myosin heavy subunit
VNQALTELFVVISREPSSNINRNQTRVKKYRNAQNETRRKKKEANNAIKAEAKRQVNEAKRQANEAKRQAEEEAEAKRLEEKRQANEAKRQANEAKRIEEEEAEAKRQEQERITRIQQQKEKATDVVRTLHEKEKHITDLTAAAKAAGEMAKKLRSDREIMERKYSAMTVKAARFEINQQIKGKIISNSKRKELQAMSPEDYIISRQRDVSQFDKQIHEQEREQARLLGEKGQTEKELAALRAQVNQMKENVKRVNTAEGYAEWEKQLPSSPSSVPVPSPPVPVPGSSAPAYQNPLSMSKSRNVLRNTIKKARNATPSKVRKDAFTKALTEVNRTTSYPATAGQVLSRLEAEYGISSSGKKKGGSKRGATKVKKRKSAF